MWTAVSPANSCRAVPRVHIPEPHYTSRHRRPARQFSGEWGFNQTLNCGNIELHTNSVPIIVRKSKVCDKSPCMINRALVQVSVLETGLL